MRTMLVPAVLGCLLVGGGAGGAEPAAPAAPAAGAAAAERVRLPQAQEYQRVLRAHLATLTETDFEHGVSERLSVPPLNPDLEYQYRTYIMALLQQPHIGGKRGIPAINAPARNFLLSTIEGPKAIVVPPVWEEALATFIRWDSPGNVFRDNRALKLRAFVAAAVKLMMVDEHLDRNAGAGMARADWNGYHLVTAGSAYPVFKDELPPPVQAAYTAGLLRLGRKLLAMGPKGEACDYEMGAAVGLWYVAHATGDAEFATAAEAYARTLCTDPRYAHPAGYWVERGGLDVGFGGMANFWTVWLALASDWPFAKAAVDRAYRLRAHLVLPEPDGTVTGPSAFNNRLGSPASEDQWHWDGARDHAAAMLTDQGLFLVKLPSAEQLAEAMTVRTGLFNGFLYGNLRNAPYKYPDGKRYVDGNPKSGRYLENSELRGYHWVWRLFANGFNYPIEVNPGYEFYRPGAYARLHALQEQDSPLLRSPYLRDGTFITNFADAFVVTRQSGYAAIVHTGPVGTQAPDDGLVQFKGPMGFGGGQLSAFWTPGAGSLILARRRGMSYDKSFDDPADWRNWPLHAVSGQTAAGALFTSARIARPAVAADVQAARAVVKVSGTIPATMVGQDGGLTGTIAYGRVFTITGDGVQIETTVTGDGKDAVAELYETIPLFIDDAKPVKDKTPPAVAVEFLAGGQWVTADVAPAADVTAVRATRRDGAVQIAFTTPQRVRLAPLEWKDTFLTKARCRNVLVDLGGTDPAAVLQRPVRVSYAIAAAATAR